MTTSKVYQFLSYREDVISKKQQRPEDNIHPGTE
jgi:hypothetical protein